VFVENRPHHLPVLVRAVFFAARPFSFPARKNADMNTSATSLPDDWLTPRQAAQLLGVHPATVYRFLREGRLPYWLRAGTRKLVRRHDVLSLLVRVEGEGSPRLPSQAEALERLRQEGWL
jgi:excisionase family DNA binding protein